MLSQAQRTAILELSAKGVSKREIAQVMRLSRPTVRKVLRENSSTVPEIQRKEKAEPYRQQILDLLTTCKGNLVRVHEELAAGGAVLSYQALTGFCRRQGIGQAPVVPAAERRQRGIRQLRACGHQLLMDSHEIPLARVEKLQDLLPVGFGLLGSM